MTTTSTAEQAQQELLEEFELFDNWMDRYQYIIDMGKALPAFPDEQKRDENGGDMQAGEVRDQPVGHTISEPGGLCA